MKTKTEVSDFKLHKYSNVGKNIRTTIELTSP